MTTTDQGAPRNLAALRLPELRKMAADLGLKGISALRKGDLIAAINNADHAPARAESTPSDNRPVADNQETDTTDKRPRRRRVTKHSSADSASAEGDESSQPKQRTQRRHQDGEEGDNQHEDTESRDAGSEDERDGDNRYESRSAARRARRNRSRRDERGRGRHSHDGADESAPQNDNSEQTDSASDDDSQDNRSHRGDRRGERRGRRGRRGRDGRDNRDSRDNQDEREAKEENIQEAAGILDIVDSNIAFVRTSSYHAGPADVYVNNQMIRRLGLRSGDYIVGGVRVGGNNDNRGNYGRGRNRQKYNPLVRVDSVNGMTVEEAKARPAFNSLTPLYPNQRLRLETEQNILTTRVIDLIMPIGKGQRALIVSPPKAGKTTVMQNIANAIATNNPECYLMVVLVDERPEEVTDMQRSVKGEVISSTFDRPPSEHTAVAELAIERAKRLVEQGQDVVVLLDSITRLGRAYNNSSPASGRILSGGVDSNALYPPKRFLGAARNIENGGSLTIIATAMVETGSAGDNVIFEEFKGTGNAELKLDRKIAERRVFPAVDVNPSGTRKDELLLAPEEARLMHKLRRILSALDNQQAIDLLIKQLKKTKSNREFMMQIASSSIMSADNEQE
ncbi:MULTISPECIES: transcription termination factor Rho [unclassified Corynebacterium]|uniref:transcription termination factor Rho n=1 Tax=unclassified Corynebacterium TaxID=2624378 RepID=UPI0021670ACC|nr:MULTISPECIES: transcription termination factor Rho [unclassified Corynebacterium]MCS4489831.1 transcription termination factor Rho [Corynebacterium sp. ES2775-CONJ]MCS4491805.1 transcription termination factor Rho [Corynebacterium sp. ES2715-CONJ3]